MAGVESLQGMGRGGESPRYGQGWIQLFFIGGLMMEKQGRVYVPSIGMVNLTRRRGIKV